MENPLPKNVCFEVRWIAIRVSLIDQKNHCELDWETYAASTEQQIRDAVESFKQSLKDYGVV